MTTQPAIHPRTIVITGASSGIGRAAAAQLHALGHRVIAVGRTQAALDSLASTIGVETVRCDYEDLSSVEDTAAHIARIAPTIDVLVNNAGMFPARRQHTADGIEKTWQVNHLAPLLLTDRLVDNLGRGDGLIVMTSSLAGSKFSDYDLNDAEYARRRWDALRIYGDTKLANAITAAALSRTLAGRGIFAISLHPGVVASNFAHSTGGFVGRVYDSALARVFMDSTQRAARRIVHLATGTIGVDVIPGAYYRRGRESHLHDLVRDEAAGHRLMDYSATMLRRAGHPLATVTHQHSQATPTSV